MTDVVIQHLLTDEVIRIKCRDLVKRITIYRLAVRHQILCIELTPTHTHTSCVGCSA